MITLVSCYYDINSKHKTTDYMQWVSLYDNMPHVQKILYTNNKTRCKLPKLIDTEIVILELEDLPYYKHMDYYTYQYNTMDHNKSHNPLLYLIWASKTHFVQNYYENNKSNGNVFWMDIGMLRQGLSSTYDVSTFNDQSNKIHLLQLYPFTETDRLSVLKTYRYGEVRVGGGCYGGTVEAWKEFHKAWETTYMEFLTHPTEFIGQDQRILTSMCIKYSNIFNLVTPKTYDIIVDNKVVPGNPWFYMIEYLSTNGTPRFLYDTEYEVLKNTCRKNVDISVIIPTYNRYELLMHTLCSVLSQTHDNYEVIVIDDGSTDNRYQDLVDYDGIDILVKATNSKDLIGFACPGGRQRNIGIKESHGEYIAFIDDDDIWYKTKLQEQHSYIKDNNIEWCCTNAMKLMGAQTRVFFPDKLTDLQDNPKYLQGLQSLLGNTFPKTIRHEHLCLINTVIASSVMISRKIVNDIGYFRHISDSDDYDYWLSVSIKYNCYYTDKPLLLYRSNDNKAYEKNAWAINYIYNNLQRRLNGIDQNIFPDEILSL